MAAIIAGSRTARRPVTPLVYFDDVTSRLMHLAFTCGESTIGYFQAIQAYLEHQEKPWPSTATRPVCFE